MSKKTAKKDSLDMSKLNVEQREKVRRVIEPRDTVLGTRCSAAQRDKWRDQAKKKGLSLNDWVCKHLDAAHEADR